MIACLQGEIIFDLSDRIIVNVGGVGYEVFISHASHGRLPDVGEEVFFHIYTEVRADALKLYGFIDRDEKEMFLLLVGVSGVGPKLAMNILSGTRPVDLARAVAGGNLACLVKLPGVGRKTAERICLELKEKVASFFESPQSAAQLELPADNDERSADVISALLNLGYTASRARQALDKARRRFSEEAFAALSLEELLRQALRVLA